MGGCMAFGLIQPCHINTLVEARRFILYSNLALNEYNTWIHTHKVGLYFPQIKKIYEYLLAGKFSIPFL
jgi:hypothetical protein